MWVFTSIFKAVFDCSLRGSSLDEMRRVGELCDGKERCQFIPGQGFFARYVDCGPWSWASLWISWRCNGNGDNMIVNNNVR